MRLTLQSHQAYLSAWGVSLALHLSLAGFVVVVSETWLASPKRSEFQWEVSLVSATTPVPQPVEAARPASPPPHAVEVRPVEPTPEPISQIHEAAPPVEDQSLQSTAASVSAFDQFETTPSASADESSASSINRDVDDVMAATVKPDSAWLIAALSRTIDFYKRYPAIARRNGWEGEVVVRLTIGGDGHLVQAEIEKSSGYEVLDRDALDLVHTATPVEIRQPQQEHITLSLPVRYQLRR